MKKINRTYVLGALGLAIAAWIVWQASQIPMRLVANEPYLDKAGWIRLAIIIGESILFALSMVYIGFWITAMLGMMLFIVTLKGKKKINWVVAILLSIGLASLCYFGFTRGFNIPLPKGELWEALGIAMP